MNISSLIKQPTMQVSKRQNRRQEYLNKNKDRIERLVEKYGTSEEINKRINKIEAKSISGTFVAKDITELENLNSQYRLLKEFERSGGFSNETNDKNNYKKDLKNEEQSNKLISWKTSSVFWDAELNPLGSYPIDEFNKNYRFRGNYREPFESNIVKEEIFAYPLEDKPKFYRVQNNQIVFSNQTE